MALTVETGNGVVGADSYVTLASFKTHCDNWGYDYSSTPDAMLEQKLRLAADFIDTNFRFKGVRLTVAQEREFPRSGCTDWSGYDVTGVPSKVAKAQIELAFKAITESLYTDLDRGGQVTSESVGPISVSYSDGAPVGKVYRFAESLLKQYLRSTSDIDMPALFSTTDALFAEGMHDYDGASTEAQE
jgi:hypothetical protein